MRRAAEWLVERGAGAVLLKGGHLTTEILTDYLWDGREWREWQHPRLETSSTHGTGCTLSAAVAAGLARGHALPDAVDAALGFVQRAIKAAPGLGRGHGPHNHMVDQLPAEPL
jgi:hydroxymethylpyrimidine/phosphomethylpyrimidine kinase